MAVVATTLFAAGLWACDSCGCSASTPTPTKTCGTEASASSCDATTPVSVAQSGESKEKTNCESVKSKTCTSEKVTACDAKDTCEAAQNCEYATTGKGAKACSVADKCETAETCEYAKSGKCPVACCAVKTQKTAETCTVADTCEAASSCTYAKTSKSSKGCTTAKSCGTETAARKNHHHHGTIVETAVATGKFKTLTTALKAAGLVEALQGKGPFTVFAPTDKAFAKLPKGTVATLLKPENRCKLKAVLKYHVVPGHVLTSNTLSNRSLKTLQGSKLRAKTCPKAGVHINNARVTKADIRTKNGVIHVISTVLLPPANQAKGESGKQETTTPTAYNNENPEKRSCSKKCGK